MSALSEQCEVLRLWAKHLREGEPILASDLREAADTILNLRDMAQQAQSEKAALERRIDELCAEVERLKEREQNLVTLLRNDCDIEASWDGLRKFWYIGLTESGCLMRDRACKAEVENAKLRRMNEAMWLIIRCASGEVSAKDGLPVIHKDDLTMLRNMRRDLRNEVDV